MNSNQLAHSKETTRQWGKPNNERAPLKALVNDITGDAKHLFELQLQLLRTEISEQLEKIQKAAMKASLGLSFVAMGMLFIGLATVELLVEAGLGRWLAYLLAAVVWGGGGAFLLTRANPEEKNHTGKEATFETGFEVA